MFRFRTSTQYKSNLNSPSKSEKYRNMGNICKCMKKRRSSDARGARGAIFNDPNSPVKYVRDVDDFNEKLKSAEGEGKLVVVDFFAQWCGPCKMLAPKLDELAKQETKVVFLKVDVDESEDLATTYNVSSMPTFIIFRNGHKVEEFTGANIDKLKEIIHKHK